jgi:hypothetical protein
MEVATIKGATHNPGAPRNWTEANGACGCLPIIYRKDGSGNPECVSAWKPTAEELRQLNEGGFVILSVIGWQVPVSMYTASKDAAVATEDLLNKLLAEREHKRIYDKIVASSPVKLTMSEYITFMNHGDREDTIRGVAAACGLQIEVIKFSEPYSHVIVEAKKLEEGMIQIESCEFHLNDPF